MRKCSLIFERRSLKAPSNIIEDLTFLVLFKIWIQWLLALIKSSLIVVFVYSSFIVIAHGSGKFPLYAKRHCLVSLYAYKVWSWPFSSFPPRCFQSLLAIPLVKGTECAISNRSWSRCRKRWLDHLGWVCPRVPFGPGALSPPLGPAPVCLE